MKYVIMASLTVFVFNSCKKEIKYRPKGETITAATLHGNSDTGKVWIVDSIEYLTYRNWDVNYFGTGLGGWSKSFREMFITRNQFIKFKPDFSYLATDSVSKLLGILSSGVYDITYLINMGSTHPEDSATISLYLSCSYCTGPALASRLKHDNPPGEDRLYIEASYYEPNPYNGKYYGTAFIRQF